MTSLPDPVETPTLSVPDAGRILGLGRSASYAAAERGEIPVIVVGARRVVPTAKLLALIGAVEEARRKTRRAFDTAKGILDDFEEPNGPSVIVIRPGEYVLRVECEHRDPGGA